MPINVLPFVNREAMIRTSPLDVDSDCHIGRGTTVWQHACVIRGSRIGADCTIGRHAHIEGSTVGDRCKVQTFAYLPPGITLEDEVFVGPHTVFTNHREPTAVREGEFTPERTLVKRGAVIGANATIGPGVTIGTRAFISAGAVVVKDVPDGGTVYGHAGLCVKPGSFSVRRHIGGPDGRGDEPKSWQQTDPGECGEC